MSVVHFLDSVRKNAMVRFSVKQKQCVDSLRADAMAIGPRDELWGGVEAGVPGQTDSAVQRFVSFRFYTICMLLPIKQLIATK